MTFLKKETTKNFIFYFPEPEASSISSISSILEDNYKRIIGDLDSDGMPKIKIRVYPSVEEFHKGINAPNAPLWAVGTVWMADEIRMVSPNNPGEMHTPKSIIQVSVHEFTHCVVFSINPQLKFTCPWLSESIALYEAGQFRNPFTIPTMKKGNYPSLAELNMNMQNKKVYAVGYTIIEYIKSKWGMNSVRELIKANGNLKVVLDIDDEQFEKDWYRYACEKYIKDH